MKTRSLLGLEVLRFACTFAILLWHYQHFYVTGSFVTERQPLFWLLRPLYLYGYEAVGVFWCLSGFIFYWKYVDTIRDRRITFGHFARLRASRLYPLHLVTLVVVALLVRVWHADKAGHNFGFHFDGGRFILQLFMASNWTTSDVSFNGPAWSVSVEVVVYAAFFVLCRAGITRWWMMVALASSAEMATHLMAGPVGRCVEMFYIGALAACLYRRIGKSRTTVCVLVLVSVMLVRLVAVRTLSPTAFVTFAVPVAVLLLALTVCPRPERGGRAIAALGNLTYSSYMWHFPIQLVVLLWFKRSSTLIPTGSPWFLAAFLAGTYAIAWVSYRVIERPAQIWLRGRHAVVGIEKYPVQVVTAPVTDNADTICVVAPAAATIETIADESPRENVPTPADSEPVWVTAV